MSRFYDRIQEFNSLEQISKKEYFVLVIDEFQELYNVNSSFCSQMQNIWDSNKDDSKINLIVCGSAYSMML